MQSPDAVRDAVLCAVAVLSSGWQGCEAHDMTLLSTPVTQLHDLRIHLEHSPLISTEPGWAPFACVRHLLTLNRASSQLWLMESPRWLLLSGAPKAEVKRYQCRSAFCDHDASIRLPGLRTHP